MWMPKEERETTIIYNEEEREASIYTHSRALRNRLEKLAQERPGECRLKEVYPSGEVEYLVPKSWVKVSAPKVLSEAQKAALSRNSFKPASNAG